MTTKVNQFEVEIALKKKCGICMCNIMGDELR